MKNLLHLICFAAVCMLSTFMPAAAGAQVSATAQVAATIVTPTTITRESDLAFEGVSINSSTRGQKSSRSEEAVEVVAKKVVRASIRISGNPEYAYSITIAPAVTVSDNNHTLTVGTKLAGAAETQHFSEDGTASIAIEGAISYGGTPTENLIAMNMDDEDVPYVRNGLPVTINNY